MHKVLSKSPANGKLNVLLPVTYQPVQRSLILIEKKEKKTVSSLRKYWFSRYVDYIKNYEKVLEKNFPRTMRTYRVFSVGTRDLYYDLKKYISVVKKQNIDGVDTLTREELQVAHTMPKDLLKISPVLLISAIPFTNYIIFPLAYFFPKYLLTSHYWTIQQKLEFMLLDHQNKLKHNRSLFRCMQAELESIKNPSLRIKWSDTIACLGSGTHPMTNDIIACSSLFSGPPYGMKFLKRRHVKELLAVHGMSQWRPFRRRRLEERGILIKRMDEAIRNEGGVNYMSNDAIRWALFFRGVNPVNMSTNDMQKWLDQWLTVSKNVDENNISLLLHCPILLAYNISTNWTLIYSYR